MAAPRQQLRFGLLGPVRGWLGGAELELGPPRQRALLALLLAHAGQPVTLTTIVDVLWGTEPPRSAVNVVHRHVGMLRRIFEPGLPARASGRRLVRGAGGYRLDADEVDLLRFRELAAAASRARDADPERALRLLVEAVGLWRGPAATGTDPVVRAHPVFVALDAEHLAAVRDAADAALAAGAPEPVLPALRRAAADHPLDEPLAARLIAVLSAAGHQAEALDAYQTTRTALAADPGPDLRSAHDHVLHQQILPPPSGAAAMVAPAAGTGPVAGGGPAEGAPAGGGAEVARAAAGGAVRPARLPADLVAFAGRGRELAELVGLLPDVDAGPVVGVISGRAGIGKTALAVRWAHRVADRFPDGQLHVDLRGFDPDDDTAVEPAEALRGFLDALGVPAGRMPAGPAALTALYRGVLTGRRVLVLLDNARDASQARPLLPASPGCLAIVTSRDDLAGLVATDGAHPVALAALSPGAARDLLSHRLGPARLASEPAAVADLLSACAGLPLALAVVAARAAAHPALTLTSIATDLRQQPSTPDTSAPDAPGTARTVFSWSWRGLSEPARELFPLLALHSGPSGVAAAASLAGVPARRVRGPLEELARSSLLTEQAPGRYAPHDLLRAYAGELAERHQPPADLAAARRRLLDHQVATALRANRLIDPLGRPVPAVAAGPGVTAEQLDGAAGADAWFAAEHRTLLDAVRGALRDGLDRHVESLAGALQPYLERTGRWPDWVVAAGAALTAAQRRGDRAAEAAAHQRLGLANRAQRRHREALRHLRAALERQTDPTDQADTHRMIAMVLTDQGHVPEALRHDRRALGLYRAAGDRRGEGVALNELGWHHGLLGQYRAGLTYCTEAERLLRGLDDPVGRGAALDNLGYLHRRLGDTHAAAGNTAAARAAWRRALAILTELGHPDTHQLLERLATPTERARATGS